MTFEIRLPLKFRIKRAIEKPIVRLFYWLSRKQSIFLRIGFIERLRRKWAPTLEEHRQDIIDRHGDGDVNSCVRELLRFDSFCRKIMPIDPLPKEIK